MKRAKKDADLYKLKWGLLRSKLQFIGLTRMNINE